MRKARTCQKIPSIKYKEGVTTRQIGGVELEYSGDPCPWVSNPQMGEQL